MPTTKTTEEALDELRAGNERFVAGRPEHTQTQSERIAETASSGQKPFACVLACADSRVPVELIFDQTVGDVFVIRVAGNVAGPMTVGSAEFAVAALGTPLVVVLGHTGCGAVQAAVNVTGGAESSGMSANLASVVEPIGPACEFARGEHPEAEGSALVDHAVEANVRLQIGAMRASSAVLAGRIGKGEVGIAGAVYDLASGVVRWL